MKNIKYLSAILVSFSILTACNTNAKLKQEGVEKAIKEFVDFNNTSDIVHRIRILEVLETDQISQFSENEATCIVTLKAKVVNPRWGNPVTENDYKEEELKIKLIFKKDIDNNWVLTSTEKVSNANWYDDYLSKLIQQSQNLNIVAQ